MKVWILHTFLSTFENNLCMFKQYIVNLTILKCIAFHMNQFQMFKDALTKYWNWVFWQTVKINLQPHSVYFRWGFIRGSWAWAPQNWDIFSWNLYYNTTLKFDTVIFLPRSMKVIILNCEAKNTMGFSTRRSLITNKIR